MKIKYNNKDIELKFNLYAISQIDKEMGIEMEDLSFGEGLSVVSMGLETGNPAKIAQIIKATTSHDSKGPQTWDQLEIVVNDIAEGEGLEAFGREILGELGKKPMTRKYVEEKYHPNLKEVKEG